MEPTKMMVVVHRWLRIRKKQGGGDSDGMGVAEGGGVVVKSIFVCACVEEKQRVHVKNHSWIFFLRDRQTKFYLYYNWFESDKRCPREHILEEILKGLRVWAAGLYLFVVSISNRVCCFSTGCTWWLNNSGTKLCIITDIFGTAYSFWLVIEWF